MSTCLKYSLGLDVSKDHVHACLSTIDRRQRVKVKATRKFKNRSAQFDNIEEWLEQKCQHDIRLVINMEATGVYYEELAWFFYNKGYKVSVILPTKGKRYIASIGVKSKNDKIDAKGLARMGAERDLPLWQPLSDQIYHLRHLTRYHQQLQRQKTHVQNQYHANKHSRYTDKWVLNQQQARIDLLEQQLSEVKKQIKDHLEKDEKLKKRIDKICRIKGLSLISVVTIIAEYNGFALVENQRQLVSYAGYDIVENQSGQHTGKTKISKKGNKHVRRVLYMPALNVVKYKQSPFVQLYQRVYSRTKIKMKGYVAVQKKLLEIIYALWKKNEPYDPNYHKNHHQCQSQNETVTKQQTNEQEIEKKVGGETTPPPTQDEPRSQSHSSPSNVLKKQMFIKSCKKMP